MNSTLVNTVWSWLFAATALVFLSALGLEHLNSGRSHPAAKTAAKPGKIIFARSDADVYSAQPIARQPTGQTSSTGLKIITTKEALGVIKKREGLALEAYKEAVADQWLIGYGHAGGVDPGDEITKRDAERLLRKDVAYIEDYISARVTVPVNENEMSAMVLLAYNIGTTAFGESTVLRELNAGNRQAAADSFLLWNKLTINGEVEESPRQTKYRKIEREMFLRVPR